MSRRGFIRRALGTVAVAAFAAQVAPAPVSYTQLWRKG